MVTHKLHHSAVTAKAMSARLIGLIGTDGGAMRTSGLYDVVIHVPEHVTYRVQEANIVVYHAIYLTVEEDLI